MSPKVLAGWVPEEVHEYVYTSQGLLDKVVVRRESEWDEDQVLALMVARELRSEKGPHGQPMVEATSPLADPRRRGGHHYVAHRRIDFAQQAIDVERARLAKEYEGTDFSADVWSVEKVWDE